MILLLKKFQNQTNNMNTNPVTVYLDYTDGILYTRSSDNTINIVRTNAQLDPDRIRIDEDGYLYLTDFQGQEHQLEFSLKGPKGLTIKGTISSVDELDDLLPTAQINDAYILTQDDPKSIADRLKAGALWVYNGEMFVYIYNIRGEQGVPGVPGVPGEKGDIGDPGMPGMTPQLSVSEDGDLSVTYISTDIAPIPTPVVNIMGPKGDKGDQGVPGVQGDPGITPNIQLSEDGVITIEYQEGFEPSTEVTSLKIKGEDGATFTPSVDDAGNLTWTNNRELPNPATLNIKGPKGEAGIDGIAYVPSVSTEGLLTWSTVSSLNEVEAVNIKGPQGEAGVGFATTFPSNPKLGDTFTWGGESGLNNNCFLGYVMTGQQYVYSQLPSKLGLTFANNKTCLIPMHVIMYIPGLLQTGMLDIVEFNKTEQIYPLTFNANDELIESVTTTTNDLGTETKYMSWAVSYGLTDSQIKDLQPYIINIAKSIFDSKVSEYTTNYTSPHQLPKYLQGSAMKCKYSDFLTEDTIFNKLFTFLQENPSNIFTGLQQAITDKLTENNTYDPDVYIIPIQAVPDPNLSKSWISEMPELTEGWAPCDSVLHNGFNTNQVGSIYEKPEIGGGEAEM